MIEFGIVQPDVRSFFQVSRQPEFITCQHGTVWQVFGLPIDFVEDIDRIIILRVRFPSPNDLHGMFCVLRKSEEAIEIRQQKICSLVSRKSSRPYYSK